MSFLCGTFFSLDQLPAAAAGLIELLPLTHASYSLRAIVSNGDFPLISLVVLAFYAAAFFITSVLVVQRVR
jgi:ABC-type polysaccharide/polyol phosphate export permease